MSTTTTPVACPQGTAITRTFVLWETGLDHARALLAKANKRAARHGLPGYTAAVSAPRQLPVGDAALPGVPRTCPAVDFTISSNAPCFAGWEFTGTIAIDPDAGALVHPLGGLQADLAGVRARAGECDQCGVRRHRTLTFLVRHTATGEIRQIGGSCVELFLGMTIPGLASLARTDPFAELTGDEDELRERGGGGDDSVPLLEALKIAAALVRTHGYVSGAAAAGGGTSTADLMRDILYGTSASCAALRETVDHHTGPATAAAAAARDWALARAAAPAADDFALNLGAVARAEWVSARNLGYAAYMAGGHQRALAAAALATAQGTSAHQGAVKERITREVTIASADPYDGEWGVTHRIAMLDTSGNRYVWWSSKRAGEPGDRITLTATVKKHEVYRGRDGDLPPIAQTILTRGRFTPIDSG